MLGIRQRRLQRFQGCLPGQQPDRRQQLRVDAGPGQAAGADAGGQPFAFEGRLKER